MNELGETRALKVNLDRRGVHLLEGCEGADVTHKDPEEQILNVIALGGGQDAVHLGRQERLGPRRNPGQEILKGLEGLLGLLGPLAGRLGAVVDAPETIGDMRNERPGQVLAKTLLDELTVHLFRRRGKSSFKQTHASLRSHSDGAE